MKALANFLPGFANGLRRDSNPGALGASLRAAAFATLASMTFAAGAEAQDTPVPHGPEGLKRVGPVDSYNGFPYWYEDKTGLKLGVCKDPAQCFFAANPLQPISFPQTIADAQAGNFNYPDEVFYYAIENLELAALPSRARLMYHVAIEGAFATGNVMPGQQVVFARLRIRLRNMVPESLYIIRHPYGEEHLETDAEGTIFYTRDLGLAVGDFNGALYGDIGPFLVPTGFNRNSPRGTFLSDGGLTLETVEGSPIGRNYVEYEGPGLVAEFPALAVAGSETKIRSSVFSMQGQIAEQLGVGVDGAYYSASVNPDDSSLLSTQVTVFAQSGEGQSMIARAQNGTWTPMQEQPGAPGHYFAQIDLGNANAALPTNLEVRNATDAPVTMKTQATIPDLVSVHEAKVTLGQGTNPGTLAVQVTSTDRSASRTVDVEVDDFQVMTGVTGGVGDAAMNQPVPATYVPPMEITVRSSAGGSTTFPLTILGQGKSTQAPQTPGPVADAGPDMGFDPTSPVNIRSVITISASASTGNIANYMWSPPVSGFDIDAAATQGAQLVGTVTAAGDLVFSVTVIDVDGRASTDTILVRVTDPNVVQDNITVTAARFDGGRNTWDIAGTTDVFWDQRMDIYLALVDANGAIVLDPNGVPVKDPTRRIGAAFSGDLGLWRFRGTVSLIRPEALPTGLDTTIVVESALGGKAAFAFRVVR